ncbi:MAG: glycosyltransferase family 39 protein [Ilumatobacteraceae bacterium]
MGTIGGVRAFLRRQAYAIGVCALALVLRLPGVFNGLPYIRHPDEPVNYRVFHGMVASRSALPDFYDYPSLQYDLQAAVHALVSGAGNLFGLWGSVDALDLAPGRPGANLALNSEPWVVARLVTVAVSLIGVAIVVGLATRLSGSRRWGAVAGVFAAVSGVGIETGFLITPDALAGTLAIAVIAMAMRLHGPGAVAAGRRWVVITGVLFGLSVGAKYNNGVLAIAIVAAVLLAQPTLRPTARQLAALTGIALATFLLTTPAIVFDLRGFLRGLDRVLDHYSTGHPGYEGNVPASNLRALWGSDAVAVVLAAFAAITLRRSRPVVLLVGWVLVYFGFTSIAKVHFDRNLTPLLGAVAVLAALGGQRLWQFLRTPQPGVARPAAIAATLLVLAPITVLRAGERFDEVAYQLSDHQAEARSWLAGQIPAGSAVLTDYYSPWLDDGRYVRTDRYFVAQEPAEAVAAFATTYDAIIVTSAGSGRFVNDRSRYPEEAAVVDSLRADACDSVRFEDADGYWVEVYFQRCP